MWISAVSSTEPYSSMVKKPLKEENNTHTHTWLPACVQKCNQFNILSLCRQSTLLPSVDRNTHRHALILNNKRYLHDFKPTSSGFYCGHTLHSLVTRDHRANAEIWCHTCDSKILTQLSTPLRYFSNINSERLQRKMAGSMQIYTTSQKNYDWHN